MTMFLHALPLVLTALGQVAPPAQVAPAQVITAPLQVARPPATPPKTYDETADAKAQIAKAVAAAATDDIRVLINWGANDDDRCKAFVAAQRSRGVSGTFFSDEYRQVYVDVWHLDKNLDVAASYGATLDAGALPALTVLDQRGKVVANVSSRDLAAGAPNTFDPALISSFLRTYQAPAPDAIAPFEAAVTQAKRDGKTVMVWFSAPW
jgi:thioredoxin 1